MAKSEKIIHLILQFSTILILVIGYGYSKIWNTEMIILVMIPFLWIAHRLKNKFFSGLKLVIFVGISAYGLLRYISPYLMIAAVSSALACWELEDHFPNSTGMTSSSNISPYEEFHLKILGVGIAIGLFVAETGSFLNLSLSFGVIFLVAVAVLISTVQLISLINKAYFNNSD